MREIGRHPLFQRALQIRIHGRFDARGARLPLAQTLKGRGTALPRGRRHLLGWGALLAAFVLALMPPVKRLVCDVSLSLFTIQ